MNCVYCRKPASYRCECNSEHICDKHANDHIARSQGTHKFIKVAPSNFINEIVKRLSSISRVQEEIYSKANELIRQIQIKLTTAMTTLETLKKDYLALFSNSPEDRISTNFLNTSFKIRDINISNIVQEIDCSFSNNFIEIINSHPQHAFQNNIPIAMQPSPYQANNRISINPRDSFQLPSNYTINTARAMAYNPFDQQSSKANNMPTFEYPNFERNQSRRFTGEAHQYPKLYDGHTDEVLAVAISITDLCATGGKDKSLKFWNLNSYQLIKSIENLPSYIRTICIASDDSLVISAGDDTIIRVHNIESGDSVSEVLTNAGIIRTLKLASDNIRVLFGSDNGKIGVWGIDSKSVLQNINGHGNGVLSLAIANDDKCFISGGKDNNVKIWSFPAMVEKSVLRGHEGYIQSVAILANNTHAVSAGTDMRIILWNMKSKKAEYSFTDHESYIFSLALTADQKSIISSSIDGTILVFDIASKMRKCMMKSTRKSEINSLAVTSDNKIVSVDNQSFIRIWDFKTSKQLAEITSESAITSRTYRNSVGPK